MTFTLHNLKAYSSILFLLCGLIMSSFGFHEVLTLTVFLLIFNFLFTRLKILPVILITLYLFAFSILVLRNFSGFYGLIVLASGVLLGYLRSQCSYNESESVARFIIFFSFIVIIYIVFNMVSGVDYNMILPGSKNHFSTKGILLGFLVYLFSYKYRYIALFIVGVFSLLSFSLSGLIILVCLSLFLIFIVFGVFSFKSTLVIFMLLVLFSIGFFDNSFVKYNSIDTTDFRYFVHANYLQNRSYFDLLFGYSGVDPFSYFSEIYGVYSLHSSYLHSIDRLGLIFVIPIFFVIFLISLKLSSFSRLFVLLVFIRGISDVVFLGHGHLDIIFTSLAILTYKKNYI